MSLFPPTAGLSANGSSALLQALNLECLRGENLLFEGLSFELGQGKVLQVEGANGCGKTSLLRILAGLSPPAEGEVWWRGENIAGRRSAFLAEIAYLGHQLGLKAELTVTENLRLGFALKGLPYSRERRDSALARVGLADKGDLAVRVLSAGQRQRVALARLIFSGALLWILDEPFSALDRAGIALAQEILAQHAENGGLAVFTSHQPLDFGRRLERLVLG